MGFSDVLEDNSQSTSSLQELKDSLSSDLSDVQLWNQIKSGKSDAMVKLYKRHYHILYSYGLKTCKDKDLTKDSIQEIFTNIWASHSSLNKVRNIRSYLLQSLWNKLVREMKKNDKSISLYDEKVYSIEPVFSVEHRIINEEGNSSRSKRLNDSIALLSKSQREIIFMIFYEGLSYKEIAEKKSVNYQSVKNLVFKAINNLRENVTKIAVAFLYPITL
ncbi:MAG: sigma-70 family RNA polymerase sigma factor [Cyclobacteriaceae bacterium]|jgi:RNA polymerase sigma factor (sigma-70 family)|nr:sigma-70 family RNA polymerase sigma factor [Cyclobacteriaceae bacterium]